MIKMYKNAGNALKSKVKNEKKWNQIKRKILVKGKESWKNKLKKMKKVKKKIKWKKNKFKKWKK